MYLLLLGLIICNPGVSPDSAVSFQVLKVLRITTDWEIISELLLHLFSPPSVISITVHISRDVSGHKHVFTN